MKISWIFLARLFMATVVLSAAGASCGWAKGMMRGQGGMMGGEGMREMITQTWNPENYVLLV